MITVGDAAPDFSMQNQDDQAVALARVLSVLGRR